jgi:DNA polymerase III subunit epsilon
MREIILDTETTGLDPASGHRVVEIGCVEVVNFVATGKTYHVYLNPERAVPNEASAVHGLTDEFLADKPVFAAVVGDFLEFIGDDRLVIHNAAFDLGFLNAELKATGFTALPPQRALDTVTMARQKFPGQRASLDALCDRFGIDRANRKLHGALLDAQLLAEVYLELRGGRQPGLAVTADVTESSGTLETVAAVPRTLRTARAHAPTPEETAAHEKFLQQIKEPLWKSN